MLLSEIKRWVKEYIFKLKWKKNNSHNQTLVNSVFPMSRVTIGRYTYGVINPVIYGDDGNLQIGDYCSIGPNVLFIVSSEHKLDTFSTYPFKVKVLGEDKEAFSKGDIRVGNDVWIGANSIILSGVSIGTGAVIAAGSVVTKDIPEYAIAAGNPAKIIKFRFNEELRKELHKIKFNKIDELFIKNNLSLLYSPITMEIIEKIVGGLEND